MSIGAFVLFAGIVFFASVVQGISGFAFGLIVLMVFPHLFGYSDALVLANLMTLVLLIYNSFLYRRYCAWKWLTVGVSVFAVTDAGAEACGRYPYLVHAAGCHVHFDGCLYDVGAK